jgi:hypothetical protein
MRQTIFLLFVLAGLMPAPTTLAQDRPAATPVEGQSTSGLALNIEAKMQKIVQEGRTVDRLTENDLADLPVGIARRIGETTYIIAIDSAYSDERGWFLSAYASVTLPGSSSPIAFAGRNIAFHKGGLSASSQTRLVLASPQTIALGEMDLVLPADGRNYLEFDCNGFKAVNLKGEFLLPAGQFVPSELTAGTPTPIPGSASGTGSGRVKATFEVNTTDLNNIIAAVGITPFKLAGLDDFSFSVRNATVDMSDLANPAGFSFPADYQRAFEEDIALWRGFYLQEVEIAFQGLDSSSRKVPVISAHNLLIDDAGLSGLFSATNVLPIHEGSADGWPFSVDRFSVKLARNRLVGGGLGGVISVPFLGKDTLGYSAELEQVEGKLRYKFSVITRQDKSFNIPLAGTVTLAPGSVITLEKKGGKLVPTALLHGQLALANKQLKVEGIKFENLGLVTQKPYIVSGTFSVTGNKQAATGGFPVRIDKLTLSVFNGQVSLGAGVALSMMNAKDKGFGASTFIQVLARMEERTEQNGETGRKVQEWKYDKIKVDDIELNCKTAAFGLQGRLTLFDNDPVYGDGFRGNLKLTLKKILEQGIQANAYFGSMASYRYWHVDVYVPTGNIPIVPPISLNGIMGGMSYHMVRKQEFKPDFAKLNVDVSQLKDTVTNGGTRHSGSEFAFVPDSSASLSFMAGATLIAGNEKAFNADAMLEVAFNQGGGLRYVQFKGSGYFFTEVKARGRDGQTASAPVYANLNMLFDNNNDVFHANMKTYLNLQGAIKGTGAGGLVGEAVIHVDPKDWYIYIGRPTQMMGVDIARLAVGQGYFMIGSKIENLPAPPSEVAEMFNKLDLNFMRNENALATGRGFAMGARIRVGFDSKDKFLPFYALLQVGAGADVMLRDYGNTATCQGRNGTLGINGWYASGQAYVFLVGRVGVQVKKKKFDFLSLGAAALLQAKLPNPTWMQGGIAGSYAVLGGLVKGKYNLTFELGEACKVQSGGNELGDIQVIADAKPETAGKEVSVFLAPQVSFNAPIGKELPMMNNEDQLDTYRVQLDECTLSQGAGKIAARLEWNASNDVVVIRTPEILPAEAALKMVVKLHWEKKLANGGWEPLKENGQVDYETREVSFTTGKAPDYIPEENVAYSYPVKGQYHFHQKEYGKGYLKLNQGQNYLFQAQDNLTSWQYVARFQPVNGKPVDQPLSYNASQALVQYDIPASLTAETVYRLTFVKIARVGGTVDQNVKREEKTLATGQEQNTAVARNNRLEGGIAQNVEKDIYGSAFRTSKFATAGEKFETLRNGQDLIDIAKGNLVVIGKRSESSETLDAFEINGLGKNTAPLVQVVASPENNWYKNTIYPLLYELYRQDPTVAVSDWREASLLGTPPLKGVKLYSNYSREGYQLNESQISSGVAAAQPGSVLFAYYLSYYAFFDYDELRNKAARKYLSSGQAPESVRRLLAAKGYTDLLKGQYPVEVSYTLPGSNQVTSRQTVTIRF